jgi:hypothetical protein
MGQDARGHVGAHGIGCPFAGRPEAAATGRGEEEAVARPQLDAATLGREGLGGAVCSDQPGATRCAGVPAVCAGWRLDDSISPDDELGVILHLEFDLDAGTPPPLAGTAGIRA